MKPKANQSPESVVREIKRKTRRKFQSDEKIRIILDGLKGEGSIASICRREGISPSVYYKWSKAFLQAGKRKLKGDTIREAGSDEVSELRKENEQFKQLVAELSLKNRVLKKKFEWSGVKLRRYMRYSQSEKVEIIRLVEQSPLSVKQTLIELDINRSTFYKW